MKLIIWIPAVWGACVGLLFALTLLPQHISMPNWSWEGVGTGLFALFVLFWAAAIVDGQST